MTDPVDQHYTPAELASAIVARLIRNSDLMPGDRILDPCVGAGAFATAIRDLCPDREILTTIDIDEAVDANYRGDFLAMNLPHEYDATVSNPPYSLAQEFIEKALSETTPRGCVAFLLPLQFLASVKRREFFARCPPSSVDVIRPRPSFASDGGTDMREYALFRWHPQDFECLKHGGTRIGFLDWEKPQRQRAAKAAEYGDPCPNPPQKSNQPASTNSSPPVPSSCSK